MNLVSPLKQEDNSYILSFSPIKGVNKPLNVKVDEFKSNGIYTSPNYDTIALIYLQAGKGEYREDDFTGFYGRSDRHVKIDGPAANYNFNVPEVWLNYISQSMNFRGGNNASLASFNTGGGG
ncbi:hypothetical protein [Helicobacter sp. 11S02629-2]|uniref:hypothetical protein n=1 Tax=Helicobacter sp. 11S02629-2 TaxID=1476195 RepID=UPI000BA567F7|nr:hypothetical protein [Helicobacter sp. 11S02629-2]PAF42743.1 hypothetical protein BKH40_07560 [Helicobacter sp. 11S02629-2]